MLAVWGLGTAFLNISPHHPETDCRAMRTNMPTNPCAAARTALNPVGRLQHCSGSRYVLWRCALFTDPITASITFVASSLPVSCSVCSVRAYPVAPGWCFSGCTCSFSGLSGHSKRLLVCEWGGGGQTPFMGNVIRVVGVGTRSQLLLTY